MTTWWKTFFDDEYLRLWGAVTTPERTAKEVEGIWQITGLAAGARVLDAPCGWGRIARALAERGARVLGVDQSAELLARAEADRGDLADLRYLRHDLRQPLDEGDFDVALNVFSSIGYGTDDDDLAILGTLARAVAPGGRVLVETAHRDMFVSRFARGAASTPLRLPDGTILMEEPVFDPVAGRVDTVWHWAGPSGVGTKPGHLRIYSITELCSLIERAGLHVTAVHAGCTPAPFKYEPQTAGGRVGIVAVR